MNNSANSSKESKGTKSRTKLVWLGVGIIFVVAMVFYGWNWTAGTLKKNISDKLAEFSAQGNTITCNNLDIEGFPFRLGVRCSHTAYDDSQRRFGMSAGAFRTAAQIYNPGKIIAELDGPMLLSDKSNQFELNWQNLKASAKIDLNHVNRTSIEATELQIDFSDTLIEDIGSILARDVQFHLRQNNDDLDFAASAEQLSAQNSNDKIILPDSEFFLVSKLLGGADVLAHSGQRAGFSLHNSKINLEHFNFIGPKGAKFSADGPISVSNTGLLSGELNLVISNVSEFVQIANNNYPEISQNLEQLNALLLAFQNGPGGDIKIKLTLRDGFIQAGLIPLGFIPAI